MMKKKSIGRFMALCLSGLLCGCGVAQPQPAPQQDASTFSPDATMRLVDNSASSDNAAYLAESPAIDDERALVRAVEDGQPPASEPMSLNLFEDAASPVSEVRSVWISYLEMKHLLTGKTKEQFTANISQVLDNVRSLGLNSVVVQVRPYGDACYASDLFPWSHIVTGTEGQDPGYDPLEVMIREAKARGLRFEAWINPYRIRPAGNTVPLCSDNPAKAMLADGDGSVIQYNGIISYNPASQKARDLIVAGAVEIVRNYDVDSIHIDDYFYPTTDPSFDSASYTAYKNGGGAMPLGDWRRNNVELLIKSMYSSIKAAKPGVQFGISPQGNLDNNYNGQYLDVNKIVSNTGYCDYICPQVYYGFQNQTQPFAQVVDTWNSMITVPSIKLYIGIGAYKIGNQDQWAGSGQNEWLNTATQLEDMVAYSRAQSNFGGFVLYRYDSLFNPENYVKTQVETEVANLKSIL